MQDDRANDDDGYDVLKSWKFGLHDWAEASAQVWTPQLTLKYVRGCRALTIAMRRPK